MGYHFSVFASSILKKNTHVNAYLPGVTDSGSVVGLAPLTAEPASTGEMFEVEAI
jgi:hypothetical protein